MRPNPHRGGPSRYRRFLAPLLLGTSLNPINSSVIVMSLVLISEALDEPLVNTVWLVTSFYLASAIAQPLMGSIADRFAPYPVFCGGLVLVAVGGICGALTDHLAGLVAARVLIAVGTSSAYPAAVVMIRIHADTVGDTLAARALATLSAAQQVAAALAPVLGGLLLGSFGWRIAFLINVPIALAAIPLSWPLRHVRRAPHPGVRGIGFADPLGMVLMTAVMASAYLALAGTRLGRVGPAVALVATGALLVVWERTQARPVVDVRLLARDHAVRWTFTRFLFAAAVQYSAFILWPQWLQQGRGLSVPEVAMVTGPVFVGGAISALLALRARRSLHLLTLSHVGLLLSSLSLVFMGSDTPRWVLLLCGLPLAFPSGLLYMANQAAIYKLVPAGQVGASIGLLRACWYMGAVTAAALGGVFFGARADAGDLRPLGLTLVAGAVLVIVGDLIFHALRYRASPD